MRPAHLSRLNVVGGDLRDLGMLHAEWALGVGRFAALRGERLAAGIPVEVRAEDIAGDRLRFGLPEPAGTRQTSVVRLSPRGGTVLVEHLVVREGPDHLLRHAMANAPEVVRRLVTLPGVEQGHDPIDGVLRGVGVFEVRALVDRIVARNRAYPIVLVSVENATRDPLLDPDELARRLVGMAHVRFLSTASASRELKDELMGRGFSDKFGCYNGGIRILWPGIEQGDEPYDHLLMLPARLLGIPEYARAEHVAGVFCEMIAEEEDLRAWLREVDAPAKAPASTQAPPPAREQQATRTASAIAAPNGRSAPADASDDRGIETEPSADAVSVPAAPPSSRAAALDSIAIEAPLPPEMRPAALVDDGDAPEHRPFVDPPLPETRSAESHWAKLAGDVMAAFDLAAELERELDAKRQELVATRRALRRAEQERDEARAGLGAPRTVADALERAEGSLSDRLVVLRSARGSAEDSPFKHPLRVFEVLSLVALFGRHDHELVDALTRALVRPILSASPAEGEDVAQHRLARGSNVDVPLAILAVHGRGVDVEGVETRQSTRTMHTLSREVTLLGQAVVTPLWKDLREAVMTRRADARAVSEYMRLREDGIAILDRFCKDAVEDRDRVLADGAIDLARRRGASVVLLPVGGFHVDGIIARLEQRGAGFVRVKPKGYDEAAPSYSRWRADMLATMPPPP